MLAALLSSRAHIHSEAKRATFWSRCCAQVVSTRTILRVFAWEPLGALASEATRLL